MRAGILAVVMMLSSGAAWADGLPQTIGGGPPQWPSNLVFRPDTVDLGRVRPNTKVYGTAWIRNVTPTAIMGPLFAPGCDCLDVLDSIWANIAGGDSILVPFLFSPTMRDTGDYSSEIYANERAAGHKLVTTLYVRAKVDVNAPLPTMAFWIDQPEHWLPTVRPSGPPALDSVRARMTGFMPFTEVKPDSLLHYLATKDEWRDPKAHWRPYGDAVKAVGLGRAFGLEWLDTMQPPQVVLHYADGTLGFSWKRALKYSTPEALAHQVADTFATLYDRVERSQRFLAADYRRRQDREAHRVSLIGKALDSTKLYLANDSIWTANKAGAHGTVLVFFSPTCPHCHDLFPVLQAAHDSITGDSVQYVATSISPMDDVEGAHYGQKIHVPCLKVTHSGPRPEAVNELYLGSTPSVLFIGGDGHVKDAWIGFNPDRRGPLLDVIRALR